MIRFKLQEMRNYTGRFINFKKLLERMLVSLKVSLNLILQIFVYNSTFVRKKEFFLEFFS
jgi:hypothetical protein